MKELLLPPHRVEEINLEMSMAGDYEEVALEEGELDLEEEG